jgi:hypothetical protein
LARDGASATNLQATYITAPDSVRRQLNQALFKRMEVDDEGDITAQLAEPFNTLLSPQARRLAAARTRQNTNQASEPYRQIWDDSLNDEGAQISVSAFHSHRRSFRGGLNREALVGAGGFEPP